MEKEISRIFTQDEDKSSRTSCIPSPVLRLIPIHTPWPNCSERIFPNRPAHPRAHGQ
ncbi:hypothetical protein HMPREF9004_0061 [Schaalia cardiffensis F0333]|uniref:Uncharacterized protein n=1 Tax=Schaalia cardiffensis F0333 TaxID=888050 RepID=N6X728_9ACTO|nr:hypothetical protein HMPREF9004_0061 [Schaalia cardiffensis F0333]